MIEQAGPPRVLVFQLGQSGDHPGGMAQVVNRLLSWANNEFDVRPLVSTRFRRDPRAPVLVLKSACEIVLRALARKNDDRRVLVAHLSERGSFVREGGLLVLARSIGYGTVAQLHGADFDEFAARHPRLVRFVLRRADLVLVLTERARATVEALLGSSARVEIVRNPVEIPLSSPVKELVVLFAGEVGFRKGADVLAKSWAGISTALLREWNLTVAGPVADVSIARQLSSQSGVEVLGSLSHDAILDRYSTASIVVLPSRAEALPMAILEAMAAGCAVVATDVGQIENVVRHGVTGLVVSPGDVDALRDALELLMKSETDRTRMAARGAELIRYEYGSAVVRARLTELWRTVAGR